MNYKNIKILFIVLLMVLFGGLYAQTANFNSSDMMYRVSLVGAIKNPGVYLVLPSTRVSEVLNIERNQPDKEILIPIPINSTRNIIIKRKNAQIAVDLEQFYVLGDINNNPYVQDGDVIYVPPKYGEVELFGAVNKEGFFEYSPGDRILDIIDLALGLDHYAWLDEVEIFRRCPNKVNERITVNLNEALKNPGSPDNIILDLGDRIYIRYIPDYDEHAQILIEGEVLYPGYYSIDDSETTLLELLEMCGGPTQIADLQNSFLQRRSKEDQQDIEFERLKKMLIEDMTELEYQYYKTKSRELQGKFSVDFANLWLTKDNSLDILLKSDDYINIPRKSNIVKVSGQVKNPGLITYIPGKDYEYYIEQAGGYSWNARKSKIQLIRATTGERLKPGEKDIVEVKDMIFVPEKRELDYWEITKDALLIISQIATTIIVIQNVVIN